MESIQILLVEDEKNFGMVLQDFLSLNGYQVTLSEDGEKGWQAFQEGKFQLCILDVMMPKKDGFSLAKDIRGINQKVPIIFLTARGMKKDIHQGFKTGADDYITKPFDSEELLFRIKAILKRSQPTSGSSATLKEEYDVGGYHFNFRFNTLSWQGESEKLSPKEADLLRLLCARKGDLLSREEALKTLWGDDNYFNARSMDVFISKLRKRLKHNPQLKIENVHGKGFRLIENEAL